MYFREISFIGGNLYFMTHILFPTFALYSDEHMEEGISR